MCVVVVGAICTQPYTCTAIWCRSQEAGVKGVGVEIQAARNQTMLPSFTLLRTLQRPPSMHCTARSFLPFDSHKCMHAACATMCVAADRVFWGGGEVLDGDHGPRQIPGWLSRVQAARQTRSIDACRRRRVLA